MDWRIQERAGNTAGAERGLGASYWVVVVRGGKWRTWQT